jgi:hypothetical protein
MTVLERAQAWIADVHPHARHLLRTEHWLLELDPEASEAQRIAALTHDIERHFPGGPQNDPRKADDLDYRRAHSERSAQIVADWLRDQGASEDLVAEVRDLIILHELGGNPAADLVQAADSISFLETNQDLVAGWVRDGRADPEHARAQHTWMFERIRIPRARELARPFFEEALARV